jgi:AcrR family transcriptional regulator
MMNRAYKSTMKAERTFITGKGAEKTLFILDAARHLYATLGYAGLTMRAVAAAVGMSLGNLQHYFANKDALVAAVFEFMMDGYQTDIEQASREACEMDGQSRFQAAIDMLLQRICEIDTQNIFIETWALATRDEAAAQLMERIRRREHLALFNLLRPLAPNAKRKEHQQQARFIVLLIEGTLVQLALDRRAAWKSELISSARRQIMLCASSV